MPQQDSQPDSKTHRVAQMAIKAGVVMCLASILSGFIFMAVMALLGQGVEPSKIFAALGGWSCVLFCLGGLLALVGWFVSATSGPGKPQRMVRSAEDDAVDEDDEPDAEEPSHRRRG